MTLYELLEQLIDFAKNTDCEGSILIAVIIAVLTLIQIAPIKVNPWTALGKAFQNLLGIEELKEDSMDSRRARIIRFDDELINKIQHRKDMFDVVLIDCDKYERYCMAHQGYINSVADDSIKHIREVYHDCKREDAFLIYTKDKKK